MDQKQLDAIRTTVQKLDYEGYLCSLFHPRPSEAWTLRALNATLASVRDHVTNDTLAQMRLVWWRESISDIFKGERAPQGQPELEALESLIRRHALSQTWFRKLIQARIQNLSTSQFTTLDEFEAYAEQSSSPLLYLSLETLDLRNIAIDHVASHLGKAIGLTQILRGTPFHAMQNRFYLPADLCAEQGLSHSDAMRFFQSALTDPSKHPSKSNHPAQNTSFGQVSKQDVLRIQTSLQSITHQIASRAHQHLETAKSHLDPSDPGTDCMPVANRPSQAVIKQAMPVFINAVPTQVYLRRLEGCHFDLVSAMRKTSTATLPLRLWFQMKRGRLL